MVAKKVLLGTTACLALTACNGSSDALLDPAGLDGPFGYTVGEPVEVISATRGDGVSFVKYQVTFNNEEGTNITITTAEGEEIDFDLDDPATWVGEDDQLLAGVPLARLVGSDGDSELEVILGEVVVPDTAPADRINDAYQPEKELAYAVGRLNEEDTRGGFETYLVTGLLTNPDDLPRYQTDVIVHRVDGDVGADAGTLAEGNAAYVGDFLASVFRAGNPLSDQASGTATVGIDFFAGTVTFEADGTYRYDDLDDVAPDAVTGLTVTPGYLTDEDGNVVASFIQNVEALYEDPNLTGNVVTDISFTTETVADWPCPFCPATVIETVAPTMGTVDVNTIVNGVPNKDVVTALRLTEVTIEGPNGAVSNVVIGVEPIYADENDDFYDIRLTSSGGTLDTSNGVVTYTGVLADDGVDVVDGNFVEVSRDAIGNTHNALVTGEFAGAVFGPGAGPLPGTDVVTVDPGDFDEVIAATATAGTFEAGSDPEGPGYDPTIQIVGGFGTDPGDFQETPFDEAPPPVPDVQP
ncbi:MAG: hypothetical protein HKM95_05040 [Inquilinus sp.]|nr:hypothetical protein [Inquilinus sp.]